MKLQINTSGAWRDVAKFQAEHLGAIKDGTVLFARVVQYPFRIVESESASSPRVVAYLDSPFSTWRKP